LKPTKLEDFKESTFIDENNYLNLTYTGKSLPQEKEDEKPIASTPNKSQEEETVTVAVTQTSVQNVREDF